MDIAALSMKLSQGKAVNQAGISILKMAMDMSKLQGDNLAELMASGGTQTMEVTVHPNLGKAVDLKA